jgi:hypothetical protein
MPKEKDMQPPYQEEREGLSIDDITEQGSYTQPDDLKRQRGEDDDDGRPSNETPHGREETKKAGQNG